MYVARSEFSLSTFPHYIDPVQTFSATWQEPSKLHMYHTVFQINNRARDLQISLHDEIQ